MSCVYIALSQPTLVKGMTFDTYFCSTFSKFYGISPFLTSASDLMSSSIRHRSCVFRLSTLLQTHVLCCLVLHSNSICPTKMILLCYGYTIYPQYIHWGSCKTCEIASPDCLHIPEKDRFPLEKRGASSIPIHWSRKTIIYQRGLYWCVTQICEDT